MKFKRLLSFIMIAVMLIMMAQIQTSAVEWTTSKSKTATALDTDDISQVTLSLPSGEYKRTMDVVIVLDDSHQTSAIFKDLVEDLLTELKSYTTLVINIGVVAFDAVARDWMSATTNGRLHGLVSLSEHETEISAAINTVLSDKADGHMKKVGGTNTEWPVEMADDMLEGSTADEKYIIMFSDFYGFMYRGEYEVGETIYQDIPVSVVPDWHNDTTLSMALKYNTFEDVLNHFTDEENIPSVDKNSFFRKNSWNDYWSIYYDGGQALPDLASSPEPIIRPENSYSGFEASISMTYQNLIAASRNANIILVNNHFKNNLDVPAIADIKDEFLESLETDGYAKYYKFDNAELGQASSDVLSGIFENVQKDLIQLVDIGSYIVDVIGEDFNFVNDIDKISLTVGGDELEPVHTNIASISIEK